MDEDALYVGQYHFTSDHERNINNEKLFEKLRWGVIDRHIAEAFHMLWSKTVGTADYKKEEWVHLRDLLNKRGVEVG